MTLEKTKILEAFDYLNKRARQRGIWTEKVPPYRLNPPLSVAEVETFERQHKITLPDDYKHFLTEIGNGEPGPNCGLFPLGHVEDGCETRPWREGDFVGSLAEPFPYTEAWNLPDEFWEKAPDWPPETPREEQDRLMKAWDAETEPYYSVLNGAIPICDLGCGLGQLLIVTGPQRGYVWNDDRADRAGFSPLRDANGKQMTFADWYLDRLERDKNRPIPVYTNKRWCTHAPTSVRDRVLMYSWLAGITAGAFFAIRWGISNRWVAFLVTLTIGFATSAIVAGGDWLIRQWRNRRRNSS